MRVGKLNNPSRLVLISTKRYLVDWEKDGNSKLERKFRELVKPYWKNKYIVLFQMTIPGSLLKIDFFNVNKKIAVEIQGEQHDEWNPFFFKNRMEYASSIQRDMSKYDWCQQNGIKLLELKEEDLNDYVFDPDYIEKKFGVSII